MFYVTFFFKLLLSLLYLFICSAQNTTNNNVAYNNLKLTKKVFIFSLNL